MLLENWSDIQKLVWQHEIEKHIRQLLDPHKLHND